MVSGWSDNHLILLDLRKFEVSGSNMEQSLERIGIIVNKNAVINDPRPKTKTSGIRIGTAAVTTRGFKESECRLLAKIIAATIKRISNSQEFDFHQFDLDGKTYTYPQGVKGLVNQLCKNNPIYK